MNKTIFSVIIPTYNRAELLRRAMRSLVLQTYKNFEVVVCDDGSTDHTKEVVASFRNDLNIKYVFENNWGGPARPRNNGIKASESAWICFLDHDDWWYPNKLAVALGYLSKGDILYHDIDVINQKGKIYKTRQIRKLKAPIFIDLMTKGNTIATSSVIVKKDLLTSVNLFDEHETFIAVEDFDAWLKISRKTERFYYIDDILSAYWLDTGNTTQPSEKQYQRILAVYGRYLPFLDSNDKRQSEALMSYILGAVRRRSGLNNEAVRLFRVAAKSNDLSIKLKSCFLVAYLSIFPRFNK